MPDNWFQEPQNEQGPGPANAFSGPSTKKAPGAGAGYANGPNEGYGEDNAPATPPPPPGANPRPEHVSPLMSHWADDDGGHQRKGPGDKHKGPGGPHPHHPGNGQNGPNGH